MRDYGHLLSEELCRRGFQGIERWVENDGLKFRPAVRATFDLVRRAWSLDPGSVVLWHYSPFAYAWRGIPLPGVFLGVLLRTRRNAVVTILHELAYPWGRRRKGGRVLALTQHAALLAVLAGSSEVVVTTEQRAQTLRTPGLMGPRRPVHVVPVFSTMNPLTARPERSAIPQNDDGWRLGIIGFGSDGVQAELLFAALRQLELDEKLRIVLLGAPGAGSIQGNRWTILAGAAGMSDAVEFTGVLPLEELGSHIGACDLVLLLDEEGPSSRRTMLAAALAHGRPVVCTDGPNRWQSLIRNGAVAVVPANAAELRETIRRLLEDAAERAQLGARAAEFYRCEMSLERAAEAVSAVLVTLRLPVT